MKMPRTKQQFEEIREKTRKTILDAGLKLFARKGFHGTSIAEIAKEAKVSKGLAYNYFKSKDELAETILFMVIDFLAGFDALLDSEEDPYKILELLIKETFNHLRENEEFWRLYISFSFQKEITPKMKKVFEDVDKKYAAKMEKIFKKIGLRNAKAEAYYFGALFDGISVDYLLNKEKYPLKSVEKLMLKKYSREVLGKLTG